MHYVFGPGIVPVLAQRAFRPCIPDQVIIFFFPPSRVVGYDGDPVVQRYKRTNPVKSSRARSREIPGSIDRSPMMLLLLLLLFGLWVIPDINCLKIDFILDIKSHCGRLWHAGCKQKYHMLTVHGNLNCTCNLIESADRLYLV